MHVHEIEYNIYFLWSHTCTNLKTQRADTRIHTQRRTIDGSISVCYICYMYIIIAGEH